MIFGIGIDSVKIVRMEKSLASAHFAKRVFSGEENAYFIAKGAGAVASAAASFAAKEAFMKACGRGLGSFALSDIAALRRESGAPYLALSGEAAVFCAQNGLTSHLSLSHEGGLAFAFVLLEKRGEEQGVSPPPP